MDELLTQFLVEGPELVQRGSDSLLDLERRPGDPALINDAFRAVHTLKGSVGLFDLPAMAAMLHVAEDVLSAIRGGARSADADTIDSLLAVLTQTERWLGAIAATGGLPPDAAETGRHLSDRLTHRSAQLPRPPSGEPPQWALDLRDRIGLCSGPSVAVRYLPHVGSYFSGDDPIATIRAVPGLTHLWLGLRRSDGAPGLYDPFACRLVIEALASAPLADVRAALRFVPDQVELAPLSGGEADPPVAAGLEPDPDMTIRTLRVDAERVETLAATVEELVSAKASFATLATQAAQGVDARALAQGLAAHSEAMDRLVGQMHRQVMDLRMTPIAPLLRRFPRVVRELARALDKKIELVVRDNGVEADKVIIEGLFEPITHLLRNAVDHGVESQDVRLARGKSGKADIHLTAEASGGRLILTVRDEGSGIDPAGIRELVTTKGLRSAEQLAALSDEQITDLIFLPGFSTAAAVTNLSGRGVGMDAVKTAIQRLGDALSVDSEPGRGTTVTATLPLSLTLTKVIVVVSDSEPYGLPMDRVLELMRLPASAITPIRAGKAFNWRNRTVPLLSLASLLGGAHRGSLAEQKILVVRCGADVVGLAVDSVQERADVAVRPLDGLLAGMPGITGTTLLGNGQVLMILDPEVLVG